jgi:hypothetical protein
MAVVRIFFSGVRRFQAAQTDLVRSDPFPLQKTG